MKNFRISSLNRFRIYKIEFFIVSLFVFISCSKSDKIGHFANPGIALTFDDYYVDDWFKCIDLFDSSNVKVTFYISNYKLLSKEQIAKLQVLQNHGHEIAFHSTNHPDFVKYIQHNSMGRLEDEEIIKGLEMMNKDGFYPKNFAYPYGSHNEVLDNMLLRKFNSLRYLNGTKDYTLSLSSSNHNSEFYAIGLDKTSGKPDGLLLDLIQNAKENNNCLVLVGHHIERTDLKMEVPLDRLKLIIQKAKELNMKFYTISELSQ